MNNDVVLLSIADCPRTAEEVAKDTGLTCADVAKSISALMKQGRIQLWPTKCADTRRNVYEAVLPVIPPAEYRRQQLSKRTSRGRFG